MPTASLSPNTTDTLGFFNKKSQPLQISSDHLGINMQVAPKSFVMDRSGRKINDPRLDFYASAGLLAKELSPKPVPLVLLAGTPVAPASPATSVTSSTRTPVRGTITPLGLPNRLPEGTPAAATQPGVSAPGIQAMSIAQATKMGIIPRPDRRDHFAKLPNEDKTGEAARSAPSIDSVTPATRVIVPKGLALQSVDVSEAESAGAEGAEQVMAQLSGGAAKPAAAPVLTAPDGLTVTPIGRSAGLATAPAAQPIAARPVVEFDGRKFTTAGNLKRALLKKFNGDEGLANEAFEPYRGSFAPQGKTKASP